MFRYSAPLRQEALTPLAFVQRVWQSFREESGLEKHLFAFGKGSRKLEVHQVTGDPKFTVRCNLKIKDSHLNRLKILHGGTIAALADLGGSLAVASGGLFATGVTTDLNVTYISSGGTSGDTIAMRATCNKLGKQLAYTTVTFHDGKGKLFARASHTKFVKGAWEAQGDRPLYTLPEAAETPETTTDEAVETPETTAEEAVKGEPETPKADQVSEAPKTDKAEST